MEGLLQHYGMKEEKLLESQELELKNLSPEEIKKRHEELLKMKNLLFYNEIKLKRAAKIKRFNIFYLKDLLSKMYRKIHRREKEREEEEENDDEDELTKQERKRAEERLTLKHANTSRWVKMRLRRT